MSIVHFRKNINIFFNIIRIISVSLFIVVNYCFFKTQIYELLNTLSSNLLFAVTGFLIGIIAYYCALIFFRKSFYWVSDNDRIEWFFDQLFGHRRYKLVHDFKSYCKNGEQMILRAKIQVINEPETVIRAIQVDSAILLEPIYNKYYQNYIRTIYEIIFSTKWTYKRLVYLRFDDDLKFIYSFATSYTFVRTLLLEYFLSSVIYKNTSELNLPAGYNFGVGYDLQKNQGINILDGLQHTSIAYTSISNDLIYLSDKIDLHLPPGDEFSLAVTNSGSFMGFIRVSNQNKQNHNISGEDLKQYFENLFETQFSKKNSQRVVFLIDIIGKINKITDKRFYNNDILNPPSLVYQYWNEYDIDKHIYNYLFDEMILRIENENIMPQNKIAELKESSWSYIAEKMYS